MTALRIGTRGSALAVAQSTLMLERLAKATGRDVELVTIASEGDRTQASLATLGGTGVFASALREALLADECDLLVHSLKDLPTALHPGLVIGAIPARADARDALCARDGLTLDQLPEGARVGTGSPRRVAQLKSRRQDLEVVDIRGNVDTRLGRVGDDLDAVMLSAAGLSRLGLLDQATELFGLGFWPTAPGQGALALEVRDGDSGPDLTKGLKALDHRETRLIATAEREVLAGLEAGCAAPVGVTAVVDAGLLLVSATVYALDGASRLSASHGVTLEPSGLASQLADVHEVAGRVVDELLANGAATLAPLGDSAKGTDAE
ncbi:hydroxymethylbilane synthase [Frondihabitans australicus]|uniref:Hydroxymethylbilane synthase n=1 Tax=Frondihabitans australicus TaxID=386892 RepID=A0A495IJ44_9MICO|nr:hydroxymethylbilane synthase [Frondihabitans australicus]RKR75730.1 hydroxymethylbilane synthase [Frondihabitans australicus]